jgi:hypothetical protein
MDENNNLVKDDWIKPEITILNVNASNGGGGEGTETSAFAIGTHS